MRPDSGRATQVVAVPATRPRRRWRTLVDGLLVLVALAALAWFLTPGDKSAGPGGRSAQNGPSPVGVATVTKGDLPILRDALGTVTPLATVTVRTQISGQLQSVGFTEGDVVQKGAFLAQIDPRPYEAALKVAEGNLARDKALLGNARTDLGRYRTLYKQDSIAQQTLATAEATVRQDEGVVEADEGQVASARVNLAYCHIVSPVTGRAGLRQVDPGNYVTPGDTNGLVVVTETQPITVVFALPEDIVPDVLRRMKAGASLAVTAFDRDRKAEIARGTLAALDSQIDTTTGTIKLKANFANDDNALFPNQFVNVELHLDTVADAVLIPQAALQHGAPGSFVYLVAADGGSVSVRPVTPGPGTADQVQVTKGLEPGDRVVIDGVDRLREGAKIVVSAPGAGAAPAAAPAGERQHRRRSGGQPDAETAPKPPN